MSKHPKDKLIQSKKFTGVQRDILSVMLDDGKAYSMDEANKAINKFNKGRAS